MPRVWSLILVLALLPAVAVAQEGEKASRPARKTQKVTRTEKNVLGMWSIEAMTRQAAINVARRYNLDEKQEAYTHQMFTDRVSEFLDKYEDEILPLLKDLTSYQLRGEKPSRKDAMRIGAKAAPLIRAVREEVFNSNMEWRNVLNESQKKIHDFDMKMMGISFDTMEHRFNDWEKGNVSSGNPLFEPPPNATEHMKKDPRRIEKPAPGVIGSSEDWWTAYVKRFIENHKLDVTQAESAMSILRECQDRAGEYKEKHIKDFDVISTRIWKLSSAKPRDNDALKGAYNELEMLRKPIAEVFDELKERIHRIPTDAQKKAYSQRLEERQTSRDKKKAESKSKSITEPEKT